MIEKINYKLQTLAIIIRSTFKQDGITFFTDEKYSQQLGYMNRPKNYKISPHRHDLFPRRVLQTQEVLFIKSGKVRVDFYTDDQAYLESRILYTGDVILLACGGHGFEMLSSSEIIEVKQGPYISEQDKVKFEEIDKNKINITKVDK